MRQDKGLPEAGRVQHYPAPVAAYLKRPHQRGRVVRNSEAKYFREQFYGKHAEVVLHKPRLHPRRALRLDHVASELFDFDAPFHVLRLDARERHVHHRQGRVEFAGEEEETRGTGVALPLVRHEFDHGFGIAESVFGAAQLLVGGGAGVVYDVLFVTIFCCECLWCVLVMCWNLRTRDRLKTYLGEIFKSFFEA